MNRDRAIFPSLHYRKEGRAASQKRFRGATEADAAGVVFLLDPSLGSIRKTTPASLSAEASRHFVNRSATPPYGDARRGIGAYHNLFTSSGHQSGATTVYFLLFTLALLGLLTMAVDVGRFYAIQAELQAAADAAALAAGTKLVGTMSSTDQANAQWNASFDSTTGNDNRFNLRLNQFQSSANLQSQVAASYFTTLTEATANAGGGETG